MKTYKGTLENYLLEQDPYLLEENLQLYLDRIAKYIIDREEKLEYNINECHMAYCKSHELEPNHETLATFIAFMIEIGLTNHIVENLKSFKYYGYDKYIKHIPD